MPWLISSERYRVYDESQVESDDICANFMLQTSVQGCSRIPTTNISLARFCWYGFLTIGTIGTLALIFWRVGEYYNYDTHFVFDQEFGAVTFPAVTLCNANSISKRKLGNNATALHLLKCAISIKASASAWTRNFLLDSPSSNFYKQTLMARISKSSKPTYEYIRECFHNLAESKTDPHVLISKYSWQLDQKTLLNCQFQRQKCSAQNFIHTISGNGNCYTFSPPAIPVEAFFQKLSGSGNGLYFAIDININDTYNVLPTNIFNLNEVGLKLAIHPPHEPALVDSRGLAIGPNLHSYIAVEKTTTIEIKKPHGNCTSGYSEEHKAYFNITRRYSRATCIHLCMLIYVEKSCHCKPYFGAELQHRIILSHCTVSDIRTCVISTLAQFEENFSNLCSFCAVGCTEIHYTNYVTSAPISGQNEQSNQLAKSIVIADIFYPEVGELIIRRVPDQTLDGLIADVGGSLGIFVGFSFISFVEIFELGIYYAIRIFHQHFTKQSNFNLFGSNVRTSNSSASRFVEMNAIEKANSSVNEQNCKTP